MPIIAALMREDGKLRSVRSTEVGFRLSAFLSPSPRSDLAPAPKSNTYDAPPA